MIQEDYVSFEIAKLLKEKWFPINEFHQNKIGYFKEIPVSRITEKMIEEQMLSCIPQSVVMKWLREVHKIDICTFPVKYDYITSGYNCDIYKDKKPVISSEEFKSYEKAVETAIKYCLKKLI